MSDKRDEYLNEFSESADIARKWQQRYMALWYGLGWPQIIISTLLTYFTSPDKFNWITLLGLISVGLSTSLVFFDIRAKVEKFKDTKLQYLDLCQDIEESLLSPKTPEEIEELLADSLEKEKYIIAYAISPSECLRSVC